MENQETSPDSHSTLVDTFCEITSSSREEAQFFLESHNFDLDSAVSTFLETSSVTAPAIAVATSVPATRQTISPTKSPSQSQSYSPSASASSSPSRSRSLSPPPHLRSVRSDDKNNNPYNLRLRQPMTASSNASKKKASSSRTGGIRALSDLNRRGRDTSDSEDDPQEYYTGGEKSGMLVQDPSKVSDVDAIFNQARRSGAGEGQTEQFPPSSTLRSFTGTARLLSGETVSAAAQHPEVITHNIIFWGNGFSVDDGPLRRLDDPTNASFLESIRKSECPKELEPANRGTVVHVNLTRKEENFPVAARRCFPFQGVGRTLGSSSVSTSVKQDDAANSPNVAPTPSMGLVVDQNLPSTSLQLRLADGTRMVSHFNHHHTIRDIHAFIDSSRTGGTRTYQLQTVGFPPKLLLNMDETIEQAGLANSVVIQKL